METIAKPLASALCVALALFAAPAWAQPEPQPPEPQPPEQQSDEAMQGGMTEERDLSDEQARLHFRAGRGLYDAGRFQQAAEEFEEAYRLSQRPELLFNSYVAYRDANDLEGAVRSLGGYLEHAEDVPDRVNLQARLESMTAALEEARAREAALEETRRREEEQRRAPPPASGEIWPWIVMGAGAAMVGVGAATGAVALGDADALVADCDEGDCDPDVDLEGRRSSVQALGITTDVLLFGGGAIAVAGLVLGIVLNSGGGAAAAADQPEVSAGCGPTGCGATLRTRF